MTLIESVLSSLPVYYLSIFKMPLSVIMTIDHLRAAFLWGGSELRKKIHMVKWEEISAGKEQGGLGIRKLKDVNDCLLAKWWLRFGIEDNSLWKRVLCSRYQFSGGRWAPFSCSTASISRIWGGILSVGQANPLLLSIFLHNSKLVVGNGHRTHFWIDQWIGQHCLRLEFPRLYSLSTEKEISLGVLLERRSVSRE